ncbi:MAG: hypothetical protein D5R96_08190 [Methanocalculus sp. MSAO_Arc2]|uniref:type II toxin-antitoxin system CcdA family antitoxin n=1 Tax=Methanocalculus sp. MSAO_Arc2 TaxID=2293855 RepID=UPI000FF783BB|nr:MAG: hypothetical protein D5R96_08190 [Methanocalculus sp. MSAO_Arc2]
MSELLAAGTIYQTTCLRIPAKLKAEARAAGINLSRTLKEAIEEKLAEGAPTATKRESPSCPDHIEGGARQ